MAAIANKEILKYWDEKIDQSFCFNLPLIFECTKLCKKMEPTKSAFGHPLLSRALTQCEITGNFINFG